MEKTLAVRKAKQNEDNHGMISMEDFLRGTLGVGVWIDCVKSIDYRPPCGGGKIGGDLPGRFVRNCVGKVVEEEVLTLQDCPPSLKLLLLLEDSLRANVLPKGG